MSLRRLAACCLAAACAAQAAQATDLAPPADPERHLQAIRQALVDSLTSAPVRVQTFGWIDTEGRLHESTQFSADTRVRGVRLPAHVADPAAEAAAAAAAKARVEPAPLPAGLGPLAASDPDRCLAAQGRWRQGLHLEVAAPGHHPQAQRLAGRVERAFLAAARESRRWLAQPRPYQGATAYERALLGRDLDRTEWLARVELAEAGAEAPQLRVALLPLREPARARHLRVSLEAADAATLEAAMAELVAALDREAACEPLGFAVTAQGGALRLREGAAHGLQEGDRLLLVERQHLPGRLLEPGAVRSLAIVQVERAAAAGTPLRWVAGPRPQAPGDWVALPL
ncbi:hypothetical protein ACT80S_12185 [Ramlibacter sp. MAHUQ-53]|uniref:hypothetical protein n=1 Tax=unclassified Ramlibacter TaxID=2617605 RepID=UPI0036434A32